VARAELRAEKGRRAAALNDFNSLLSADAPPDAVSERALYGRATCRAQMGDGAGARADLENYLSAIPDRTIRESGPHTDRQVKGFVVFATREGPRGDKIMRWTLLVAALAVLGGCDHHHGIGALVQTLGRNVGGAAGGSPNGSGVGVQWPTVARCKLLAQWRDAASCVSFLSAVRWKHGKLSQHQQLWEWTDRHWRVLR